MINALPDKSIPLFFVGTIRRIWLRMTGCLWLTGGVVMFALSLFWHPVDALTLTIDRESGSAAVIPLPLGRSVTARYEHSVERTPVDDVYYVTEGKIRQWQTRTRSHNAGLPWKAPERGRFVGDGEWLVLEGGLPAWDDIRLRVGNECLGRNELIAGNGSPMPLYAVFPNVRLILSANTIPLGVPLENGFWGAYPLP